jgi:hypothetical protein
VNHDYDVIESQMEVEFPNIGAGGDRFLKR